MVTFSKNYIVQRKYKKVVHFHIFKCLSHPRASVYSYIYTWNETICNFSFFCNFCCTSGVCLCKFSFLNWDLVREAFSSNFSPKKPLLWVLGTGLPKSICSFLNVLFSMVKKFIFYSSPFSFCHYSRGSGARADEHSQDGRLFLTWLCFTWLC